MPEAGPATRHREHIIKQPTHPPSRPLKPGITDLDQPLPLAEGTPPPPISPGPHFGAQRAPPSQELPLPGGCHGDVAEDESASPGLGDDTAGT